jgi:hypothetical protein
MPEMDECGYKREVSTFDQTVSEQELTMPPGFYGKMG